MFTLKGKLHLIEKAMHGSRVEGTLTRRSDIMPICLETSAVLSKCLFVTVLLRLLHKRSEEQDFHFVSLPPVEHPSSRFFESYFRQ